MKEWRDGGVNIGDIHELEEGFESRLGHSWAQGRLKVGDHMLALRHTGDCFFEWMLLNAAPFTLLDEEYMRYDPVPKAFGAYVTGKLVGKFTNREIMMANSGMVIELPRSVLEDKTRSAMLWGS